MVISVINYAGKTKEGVLDGSEFRKTSQSVGLARTDVQAEKSARRIIDAVSLPAGTSLLDWRQADRKSVV